jgi:hypothetical protein
LDDFAISPISLQRSDIVRFLATPPEERGRLFVDHFLSTLKDALPSAGSRVAVAKTELADLKAKRRDLMREVADRTGVKLETNYVELVQRAYFDGLSKRQYEDRYSRKAPPEGVRYAREFERLGQQIAEKKRELSALEPGKAPGLYEQRLRALAALLGSVDTPLTESFISVTGISWVKALKVVFGRVAALSIEIEIELKSGEVAAPEQLFSEGYQDLVAFLFFMEVTRAAAGRGQARVLILDDVFQSVDSSVRLAMLSYALRALKGWQLFITVHDPLWKAQVVDLMRQHNFGFSEVAIRRWMFDSGPLVLGDSPQDNATLAEALEKGNVATICSEAGRLLEQVCDRLSYLLPISVTRRPGDRYTLGDLWPGIAKKLKNTTVGEIISRLNTWLHLRNMVGAHYNEWAASLAVSDAEQFGTSVLRLLEETYCNECRNWIRESPEIATWVCRCGRTAIHKE